MSTFVEMFIYSNSGIQICMGRITIAVYRPKKGREAELDRLVKAHLPVLRKEGLVTGRVPVVMKAADQTVVEVFEWKSKEAISLAHSNAAVLKMWESFNEVCDYLPPVSVPEFQNMFAEFEAAN